ncbi:putative transporter [Pseudocercospora fuligena]|uniref:Putative transporter n=1 Tax=Pseudocercospora fuligena TaxID=685502 RepID=A0A8H6RDG4_9PEZI|nr:putative transporter [Pseudocercospora fuligena]
MEKIQELRPEIHPTSADHQNEKHTTVHEVRPSSETSSKQTSVDYAGARGKVDPEEIKLVRKLDLWITPTLFFMFFLNYLDRNALALAPLDGIKEELHLDKQKFETCVSMLYVGYLLGQVPSNMLLVRVRPSLYVPGCMALWAIVSTLTCLANDYKSMVLCRFFLGITEAPFIPAAFYLLATFYTRKELATRVALLLCGSVLSTAFAGLIALGFFKMGGIAGLEGWRWMFLIQGVVTFVVAIGSVFTLPNEPLETRWLTPDQRQLAFERIQKDTVEAGPNTTSVRGLIDAAKDKKLWVFVFMLHAEKVTISFKNFLPTVVKTLGFSQTITLVLTCPPYLVATVVMLGWSLSSGKFNERTWHVCVGKTIATFGFTLAACTMNTGARYFAMMCFVGSINAVDGILFGWVAVTCGQTREKKACSLALANPISTAAMIWSPYLYRDPPRFVTPMATNAGLSVVVALCALVMRWMLKRENRKLREMNADKTLFYAY